MLEFDEAEHRYRWEGRTVPGVTAVMSGLNDFGGIPDHLLNHAAERGTAVHRACELHVLGDLDESSLSDEIRPFFYQFLRFLNTSGFEAVYTEQRVYSKRHGYAGTLDLFGKLNRSNVLIDIKTPAKMPMSTGPQSAAYEHALREMKDIGDRATIKRFGLKLRPDSYELVPFADPGDWGVFRALLTIRNWRNKQ